MLTPLMIPCPVCNAGAGYPCNIPTETGRRDVRWFHNLRQDRASATAEVVHTEEQNQ